MTSYLEVVPTVSQYRYPSILFAAEESGQLPSPSVLQRQDLESHLELRVAKQKTCHPSRDFSTLAQHMIHTPVALPTQSQHNRFLKFGSDSCCGWLWMKASLYNMQWKYRYIILTHGKLHIFKKCPFTKIPLNKKNPKPQNDGDRLSFFTNRSRTNTLLDSSFLLISPITSMFMEQQDKYMDDFVDEHLETDERDAGSRVSLATDKEKIKCRIYQIDTVSVSTKSKYAKVGFLIYAYRKSNTSKHSDCVDLTKIEFCASKVELKEQWVKCVQNLVNSRQASSCSANSNSHDNLSISISSQRSSLFSLHSNDGSQMEVENSLFCRNDCNLPDIGVRRNTDGCNYKFRSSCISKPPCTTSLSTNVHESSSMQSLPDLQGWFQRRTEIFGIWRWQFFQIKGSLLSYYAKTDVSNIPPFSYSKIPPFKLICQGYIINVDLKSMRNCIIKVKLHIGKKLEVKFHDPSECVVWLKRLQDCSTSIV